MDEQELERLTKLLRYGRTQSRDYRTWVGISALALGGATLTSGAAMVASAGKDAKPRGESFVFYLGAAEIGTGLGLLLFPTGAPAGGFQGLLDSIEEKRAAGKPPKMVVAEIESEWREKAESMHSLRRVAGLIFAGVGLLSVGAGTYVAVADLSSSSFSKKEQHGLAGVLLSAGFLSTTFGLGSFLIEDPTEMVWKTYDTMKPRRASALKLNGVGCAPTPGGGVLALRATF